MVKQNIYSDKILLFMLAFACITLLVLSIVSATVDMKITAKVNNKKSMFLVKTDSKCNNGYDGRDAKSADLPGGSYSQLYSDLNGNGVTKLSVDCWNESTRKRVIDMIYYVTDNFAGYTDVTWNLHPSAYRSKLKDFGNDTNYHSIVGGPIDMFVLPNYTVSNAFNTRYFQIELNSFILPNVTEFPGVNTTDFEALDDLNNVENLTLQNSHGKIKIKQNKVNAEAQDYDKYIELGDRFLAVNTSGLNETFNTNSTIILNNISCTSPIYYTEGFYSSAADIISQANICNSTSNPSCTNQECFNNVLTFTASHFTGYAALGNTPASSGANLIIWDSNDTGSIINRGQNASFYANYTNITSGNSINGTNVTCQIKFKILADWTLPVNMTYNPTSKFYEYVKSFSNYGTYTWNVTCEDLSGTFASLQATDTIIINGTNPQIPGGAGNGGSSGGSGGSYGGNMGLVNASISDMVAISLPIGFVDFGNMTKNESKINLTGITIQNDGTLRINVEVSATSLWTSINNPYPSDKYLFKIGEAGEGGPSEGTFDSASLMSWIPMDSSPQIGLFNLNILDSKDIAALQFNVTVPNDESAGAKTSTITLTAYGA